MSTKLHPVKSSYIAAVAHDPDTETLTVQFKKGPIIAYKNVTVEQYHAMMSADSVGGFFLRNIRDQHPWEKVEEK